MEKNILFVYPKSPGTTYWGYEYALPFIKKKAAIAPLGPITVAAMLPEDYTVKFIDMDFDDLKNEDIERADAVFTSSLGVHKNTLDDIISKVKPFNKPIVAGGPHPTQYYDQIEGVDHFVLGEAESGSLDAFIKDFEKGEAKKAYARVVLRPKKEEREIDEKYFHDLNAFFGADSDIEIVDSYPEMSLSPIPRYDLLKLGNYATIPVQYSRGCPHSCEFCNESSLYGHKMRLKGIDEFIKELETIYDLGHRGLIFIVDDDFIGNKIQVKKDLVKIREFQEDKGYSHNFLIESTLDLAHDEDLMRGMRDVGINVVFTGIESPNIEVLKSMNKGHNLRGDLIEDVRKIQKYGMEVSGGFIVGNDKDPPDICDKIFDFCQEAGIHTAMVGLLNAGKGSPFYARLIKEDRLLKDSGGDNTHSFEFNFIPVGNEKEIISNYKNLLDRLYDRSGKNYIKRCSVLLDNLVYNPKGAREIKKEEVGAFFILLRKKWYSPRYMGFLIHALTRHKDLFAEAIRMEIEGYHFRKITKLSLKADELHTGLAGMYDSLVQGGGKILDNVQEESAKLIKKVQRLPKAYRPKINETYRKISNLINKS